MRAALRDISDFTVTVLEEMVEPELPAQAVLTLLCSALDASMGGYQRTDVSSGATVNVIEGCGPDAAAAIIERGRTRWTDHPHMTAAVRGELAPGTGQQAFGSERLWRRSAMYSFMNELGGWEHMASVPLSGGPTTLCGFSFGRPGRTDFTPEDVGLLAAVQRPLQALERHARVMARWTDALGTPAGATAAGVVRETGLTARELTVLVLLAEGHTAASIAGRLGCSPRTAQKHLEHLYRKLGVTDRLSAVLAAQQQRLLPGTLATR